MRNWCRHSRVGHCVILTHILSLFFFGSDESAETRLPLLLNEITRGAQRAVGALPRGHEPREHTCHFAEIQGGRPVRSVPHESVSVLPSARGADRRLMGPRCNYFRLWCARPDRACAQLYCIYIRVELCAIDMKEHRVWCAYKWLQKSSNQRVLFHFKNFFLFRF